MRFVTGATARTAGKAPDRLSASDEKEMGLRRNDLGHRLKKMEAN
jgi:hypothetical protein